MAELNWFVGYTYPQQEKKVYSSLLRRGLDSFLPLISVKKKWSDRIKYIDVPLFSNYVFVRTTKEKVSVLYEINGLSRFIAFSGKLATVKNDEIQLIKDLLASKVPIKEQTSILKKGQLVEIIKGPLAGLEGYLDNQNRNNIIIIIKEIGQGISVTIPRTWVRRI